MVCWTFEQGQVVLEIGEGSRSLQRCNRRDSRVQLRDILEVWAVISLEPEHLPQVGQQPLFVWATGSADSLNPLTLHHHRSHPTDWTQIEPRVRQRQQPHALRTAIAPTGWHVPRASAPVAILVSARKGHSALPWRPARFLLAPELMKSAPKGQADLTASRRDGRG
jgi:hypothetical protein